MAKETMTSRERVLTAFAHAEPDRVPIDYHSNPGIDARLKAHYGLDRGDSEGLRQVLGVDILGVHAPYVGPKLHPDVPDRRIDMWGVRTRWVEHGSGGYWDFCDFPLNGATEEEIEAWPMPSPDDWDYSVIPEQCARNRHYALFAGSAGMGCIINRIGKLLRMDQVLMDLATDNPAALRLIERKQNVELEVLARSIEAAQGEVDFCYLGEDMSTQLGPMISVAMYRKHIRSWHARFVQVAKAYDLPVVFHSCGSCSWAFDDMIEIGIDVVQTLQPEAANMAPVYLKGRWGDRLGFHGCISTTGAVSFGSVQDIVDECEQTLGVMMPGGGYVFGPAHQLQDNSPTENVVAMYDTVRRCGWY